MNSTNSRLRGLTLSLAWVAAGTLGTAAPFQLPYAASTSRDLGFTGAQTAMPSLTLSADLDGDHREDVVVRYELPFESGEKYRHEMDAHQ